MKGTYKALRRTVVFIVGVIVIIAGIVLLVIPGPGLVTIALGLLILSSEFEWADRHLKSIKKKIKDTYDKAKEKTSSKTNQDKK